MQVVEISKRPMRASYNSMFRNGSVTVVHEAKAIPHIHRVVKKLNPQLIIELGTSWGGVTLILHECNTNAELHSYDIDCPRKPNKKLFNTNVNFHIKDILSSRQEDIVKLCRDKRRKVLYCDNGNKIKEVIMYGSQLNKGDLLGVHDYPVEISTNYDELKDAVKSNTSREEIAEMNKVLKGFDPLEHDFFSQWSTRFWVKT